MEHSDVVPDIDPESKTKYFHHCKSKFSSFVKLINKVISTPKDYPTIVLNEKQKESFKKLYDMWKVAKEGITLDALKSMMEFHNDLGGIANECADFSEYLDSHLQLRMGLGEKLDDITDETTVDNAVKYANVNFLAIIQDFPKESDMILKVLYGDDYHEKMKGQMLTMIPFKDKLTFRDAFNKEMMYNTNAVKVLKNMYGEFIKSDAKVERQYTSRIRDLTEYIRDIKNNYEIPAVYPMISGIRIEHEKWGTLIGFLREYQKLHSDTYP